MCNSSKKHGGGFAFSFLRSFTSRFTLRYKDSAVSSILATTTPECGITIYASIQGTACDVRRRKAVSCQQRNLPQGIDQRFPFPLICLYIYIYIGGYRKQAHSHAGPLLKNQKRKIKKKTRFQFAPPQIMPNPRSFRTLEDFFMIFFQKK